MFGHCFRILVIFFVCSVHCRKIIQREAICCFHYCFKLNKDCVLKIVEKVEDNNRKEKNYNRKLRLATRTVDNK